MRTVIGIRPAKSGRRAVDDANGPTPTVWFDSWRQLASLLSDESRALPRHLDVAGETNLKWIEPHRLAALILEDLKHYPESAIGDIRQRIGSEVHPRRVKRALDDLIDKGEVRFEGDKRWRRYWAV